jgi:hypothetical protein
VDKQAFTFDEWRSESFTYHEQVVKVIPYLSYEEMKTLAHTYMLEITRDSDTMGGNILSAELSLMANIVDLKTNVQMYNEDGTPVFGIDQLLSHMGLYTETIQRIKNYNLFREMLIKIVEQQKFEKQIDVSLGSSVQLITARIINFLDEMANAEVTDENITKIQQLAEQVNNSPVIQDAVSIFKNGQTRKKTSRKPKA